MIKKLLLALTIATTAQAYIPAFEYESLLTTLFLEVDVEMPRIAMQELVKQYGLWVEAYTEEVSTRKDVVYMARINHMIAEVMISYQFGN